jgi:hypothetical protein
VIEDDLFWQGLGRGRKEFPCNYGKNCVRKHR